ncbi:sensor histidine kinase [Aestuariibacter halophilus]|uniref:histidine kinase n=1 Tax=Fluctibacter halophilus TaxID=226011 RepID=A0ABS8GAH8_9ALTE|nr:sensor histidine kinase [Aestuariibacter halophilus]
METSSAIDLTDVIGVNASVILHFEATPPELLITVTDTESGIPHLLISRLFDPFYRVEQFEHRETNGTGLGLSLCKRIAQPMRAIFRSQVPWQG